jgi:hypothetical protein
MATKPGKISIGDMKKAINKKLGIEVAYDLNLDSNRINYLRLDDLPRKESGNSRRKNHRVSRAVSRR